MNTQDTALVLIGFQNDYFHTDGILVGALEDQEWPQQMLRNTLKAIQALEDSPALIVSAPIIFTPRS